MKAPRDTPTPNIGPNERSIPRNAAHSNILVHDAINLLHYEHGTDKQNIHLVLIIYDFLFAVITIRFYRKTYN